MKQIANYKVKEIVYESDETLVCSVTDASDKLLIVKILKNIYPSPSEINHFRQEFELTKNLRIKGLRPILAAEKPEGRHALIMEHFDGNSLEYLLRLKEFSLNNFFKIAIPAAEILQNIHHAGIIHKDIKPANILFNKADGEVRIIDFGLATKVSLKKEFSGNPEQTEGTLAYISPEQTGRMNRETDSRTDLYSLGVTFFRMLTGRLPFETEDPVELVHHHLAVVPPGVHEIHTQIPETVGAIIAKLLQKNAEDRYLSAAGLAHDLKICAESIEKYGYVQPFRLGEQDFSGKLRLPQKLFGREKEIHSLLDYFDRTCRGGCNLVFVEGTSGSGKSVLVNEIQRPVSRKRGYLISGKYDSLQKDVPYFGISNAFNDFCTLILTENPEKQAEWRDKILTAVGGAGRLLLDIIPNLEPIIGKQAELPEVDEQEAIHRFNEIFRRFVRDVSRREHPLVLFLDDLQWADKASLNLLRSLIGDRTNQYFLIVAAYRPEDLLPGTDLYRFKRDVEILFETETLEVGNLEAKDVTHFVSETLNLPESEIEELAGLIFEKTMGQPFFVRRFLQTIYRDNLLFFDFNDKKWTWRKAGIENRKLPVGLAEIMSLRIRSLSARSRLVLHTAACIGNVFELRIVSLTLGESRHESLQALWPAVEEKLLLPLDENYKSVSADESETVQYVRFRFVHERLRTAAYSLFPENERAERHLKIGRLMMRYLKGRDLNRRIFEISGQLTPARRLITDRDEVLRFAALNLNAARKASGSSAYDSAVNFCTTALEVIDFQPESEEETALFFGLQNELALNNYRLGNFEAADALYEKLRKTASEASQIGKIYGESVIMLAGMNRYAPALQIAREGLSRLDFDFPENITDEMLNAGYIRLKQSLGSRQPADLSEEKEMTDSNLKAVFSILNRAVPAAWLSFPRGFAFLSQQMVGLSQSKGNNALSAYAYGTYAMLLCGEPEEFEDALAYSETALRLTKRFPNRFAAGAVSFFTACFVQHWRRPKQESRELYARAHQNCFETGAHVYGVYNIIFFYFQELFSEKKLADIREEHRQKLPFILRVNDRDVAGIMDLELAVIDALSGQTSGLAVLDTQTFSEGEYTGRAESENYGNGLCVYYFSKLFLHFLNGDFAEAKNFADRLKPYEFYMQGLYHQALYHFYAGLATAACMDETEPENRQKLLTELDRHREELQTRSENCPANFEHMLLTLSAEVARFTGLTTDTVTGLYEAALRSAEEVADINLHKIVISEVYARFWIRRGQQKIAAAFLREAVYETERFGAKAKAEQLRRQYGLLAEGADREKRLNPTTDSGKSSTGNSQLDIQSLMKSAGVLALEKDNDRLVEEALRIVIENAGAERGCLVDFVDEKTYLRASGTARSVELLPEPLATDRAEKHLPPAVINYVASTLRELVKDNIYSDNLYARDPYLRAVRPQSVLCYPVLRQGNLSMLFYLEHSKLSGAFTPDRVEILRLLSSQIVVALENVVLYTSLEEKVGVRTRELDRKNEELVKQNKHITDSLRYAQTIQAAFQAGADDFRRAFADAFIIYTPKDIVSGDFLKMVRLRNKTMVTVADCTGHGVPGAFMSVIGNTVLDEIINVKRISDPARILRFLHMGIRVALKQAETDNTDGMDVCLCKVEYLEEEEVKITYAGAKRPLFYISEGELKEVKGDRHSIGGFSKTNDKVFTNHEISLKKGDMIYLTTDGLADVPSPDRASFGTPRIKKLLREIHSRPADRQKEILASESAAHLATAELRDDVTFLGIRL